MKKRLILFVVIFVGLQSNGMYGSWFWSTPEQTEEARGERDRKAREEIERKRREIFAAIEAKKRQETEAYNRAKQSVQQSWGERFWAMFTPTQKRIEQAKSAAPIIAGTGLGVYLASTTPSYEIIHDWMPIVEMFGVTNPYVAYATGSIAITSMGAFVGLILGAIYRMERDTRIIGEQRQARFAAIQQIKYALTWVMSNALLYPTRPSRLDFLQEKDDFLTFVTNVLQEKGYFLEYVTNVLNDNTILSEACGQLVEEINKAPYPREQQEEDNKIDTYMTKLKETVLTFPSLEAQLIALERERTQEQPMTIDKMRAYLSLYYRLKNKLQIEKGLTPEQEKIFSDISRSFKQRMEQQKRMRDQELERLVEEKRKAEMAVAPVQPAQEGQ